MLQLLPHHGSTSVEEAYAAPLGEVTGRPWVMLCMVASLDGSTVVAGRSAGLSNDNDHAVLLQLRSIADVVLVGAGTARGEGYGPPTTPGQRIGLVTRSGRIDTSSDLFTSGAGFVITTEDAEIPGASDGGPAIDVIRAGATEVDLAAVIDRLPEVCPNVRVVQAEGGPSLNGAMASLDLFDEMNLTFSSATVGGSGPRLVDGGAEHHHRFDLERLAIDDDSFLFSRWRRRR